MENRALERTVWSGFDCKRADCQGKCVADPRKYVLATDYAALEAERDEWKRRCEKMVARCQELAELACYCEYNSCEDRISTCEYCDDAASLIAIAEGRDNG